MLFRSPTLPVLGPGTMVQSTPYRVLDRRVVKRRNTAVAQWLIQWRNQSSDDATWEDYEAFAQRFPDFIREDTNFVKGEGVQRGDAELGMTVGDLSSIEEEGDAAIGSHSITYDMRAPCTQNGEGKGEETGEEEERTVHRQNQ